MYVNDNNVTYFDSFGVEHILKENKKFIGNKYIITNIYRIQTYDSIICTYFCIGFIDFILKGKSLLDCINLFPPNDYANIDKIILKYFSMIKKMKKLYCVICGKYRKFEKPKISYLLEKYQFFQLFAVSARMKMIKYLKKKNQLKC